MDETRVGGRTVAQAAAAAIRARILAGTLAEGTSLRQDALAAELGISRIPLREAFRRLEAEGLVTLLPHRGATVSSLSLEDIRELFDLRALIEPDLLACAIARLRDDDLVRAEETLRAYERALSNQDVHAWGEMNTSFHLALYAPARRRLSLTIVQGLLANADRYTRLQLVLTAGTERAREEHRGLLDRCAARDAAGATQLLRGHIERAAQDLLAFLGTRQGTHLVGRDAV
jgi:DNA-binding GntR family transcriptional regulator